MPTTLTEREAFGVGSANIPAANGQAGDLSREKTRACLSIVEAQCGIFGAQELIEPEDNADFDLVLKPKDWYHFAESSENDIGVKRNRWRPASPAELTAYGINPAYGQGARKVSDGMGGVTPSRYVSWVILVWIDRPEWTPFVFVNTHFVSGVYKGNNNLPFRIKAREAEMAGLSALMENWVSKGLNAILTLDSNWPTMPEPVKGFQWVVDDGIDKIGFVNADESNWVLYFVNAERYDTPSDHDFRVANLEGQRIIVVPDPVLTKEQKVDAWLIKNAVSKAAFEELQAILAG